MPRVKIEWRDVPGEDGRYEVSSDGRIRRKAYELKPYPTPNGGHVYVTLGKGRRMLVHRIVALAFMSGPDDNPEGKPWINHKNGVPDDNRLDNLEWATPGENIAHGYQVNGRVNYNERPVIGVDSDGVVVHRFRSATKAALHFGLSRGAIHTAMRAGCKS